MSDVKPFFDAARELAGGKLTQDQVNNLNKIVDYLSPSVSWVLSDAGANLIKEFEGFRSVAYLDSVGVWTIGFGTIKYPNGTRVQKGDTCTEAQAISYLKNDCKTFVDAINKLVKVPLKQNQFDALVCLVYNIGETNFSGSTLLKKLNAKDYSGAADQFLVWNKGRVKGVLQVIDGLTNRRKKEREHFLK